MEPFAGKDGTVVIEAESVVAQGSWVQTTVDGETAMLWDADSSNYGRVDPDEMLSYHFVTDEAGAYHIAMHSARIKETMNDGDRYEGGNPADGERTDTGNDAYVGIFDVDADEYVKAPTKLFTGLGSSDEDLRWGTTFDEHSKSASVVTLKANTEYRLDIVGRSDGYALDKITLNEGGFLRDANAVESDLFEPAEAPVPNNPPPVEDPPVLQDRPDTLDVPEDDDAPIDDLPPVTETPVVETPPNETPAVPETPTPIGTPPSEDEPTADDEAPASDDGNSGDSGGNFIAQIFAVLGSLFAVIFGIFGSSGAGAGTAAIASGPAQSGPAADETLLSDLVPSTGTLSETMPDPSDADADDAVDFF